MKTSEQINELAAALAKAQGAIQTASKEKENRQFGSRYADLASVWEACRKPLSDNGLSVVQGVATIQPHGICVTTRLLHSSGQWIESSLELPVAPSSVKVNGVLHERITAHGYGSAITYARRYLLSAMVGIAPDDDDDGNGASHPKGQTTPTDPPFIPPPPPPPMPPPPPPTGTRPALHDSLRNLLNEYRWPEPMKKGNADAFLAKFGTTLADCMDDASLAQRIASEVEVELALHHNLPTRTESLNSLFNHILDGK